jgi:hypothetical protein
MITGNRGSKFVEMLSLNSSLQPSLVLNSLEPGFLNLREQELRPQPKADTKDKEPPQISH